ncbi:MAG TPA: response regulator [Solirubrobacteraceae bacterium]|jgi:CheY-like chemotaxis protein
MSPRLLLVEDDEDIRAVARLSLQRIGGWDVVEATCGEAALDTLATDKHFAAIVMDVMMPGFDGPATLRRLQAQGLLCDIPVVFLTAKAGRAERERLRSLGAAGVIAKPFNPVALPGQLRDILDPQR